MEKVTELANLVRRKLFVSQKIFGNILYNPYIFACIASNDADFAFLWLEITNVGVTLQADLIENHAVWQNISESKIY